MIKEKFGHGKAIIHGETRDGKRSPEYVAYHAAKARCTNIHRPDYHRYGGRGIEFLFTSLGQFLLTVGRRPSAQHSLDRYPDQNGHYQPGNVRWATPTEQSRNRRSNRLLTVDGVTKSLAEWAELQNVPQMRIEARIRLLNYCDTCAVTLPRRGEGCVHRCK